MKNLILIICIILLIIIIRSYKIENFENNFDKDNIYVKFHNIIFDNSYENCVNNIIKYTKIGKDSDVLDAGCGIGNHYKLLNNKCKLIGVDISKEMIKYAKIRNPGGQFINKDLIDDKIFNNEKFTHIVCLLDSLYHNNEKDMEKIVMNFYYWLKPGGYLVVNVFDRNKLDPGPQKFTQYYKDDKGIKHGLTYFDTFTHDAHWEEVDNNSVKYVEIIVLSEGKKKSKEIKLHIPKDKEKVIIMINKCGFKVENILEEEEGIEMLIFKKIKFEMR